MAAGYPVLKYHDVSENLHLSLELVFKGSATVLHYTHCECCQCCSIRSVYKWCSGCMLLY